MLVAQHIRSLHFCAIYFCNRTSTTYILLYTRHLKTSRLWCKEAIRSNFTICAKFLAQLTRLVLVYKYKEVCEKILIYLLKYMLDFIVGERKM